MTKASRSQGPRLSVARSWTSDETEAKQAEVAGPTRRWTKLDYHPVQAAMMTSPARFIVNPAGRRSGKTELWKRMGCMRAWNAPIEVDDYKIVFGAPVYNQAERLFWNDLIALTPPRIIDDVSRSKLEIRLTNGARLCVMGLDEPARVEGEPLDGIVLDEYANMSADVWDAHVRPALFTKGRPPGWAAFIGVPEGRGHYYKLWQKALADQTDQWAGYTWFSSDILPADEIEQAKEDLDKQTYEQEYEGSFLSFLGRVYYAFERETHTCKGLRAGVYNPQAPLILCFDFNVSPGTATVVQEADRFNWDGFSQLEHVGDRVTCVLGEVWIPYNSNTPAVCRKLIKDWGAHRGEVWCYGDATGGARGTAKTEGTDWDLIERDLTSHFGDRVLMLQGRANPAERARVNAMNARCRSASGTVRLVVDAACAETVRDFEGTPLLQGGSGEIDKKADPELSHLCFAGDTLIDVGDGVRRAADLPARGVVRGPMGDLLPYEWAGQTLAGARMVSVDVQGCSRIRCTPWHRFLTVEQGWVAARDLAGLTLEMAGSARSLLLSRSSVEFGIASTGGTTGAILGSTVPYGSTTLDPCLAERMCTTWTAIPTTTRSRIWPASRRTSTWRCIKSSSVGTSRSSAGDSSAWPAGELPRRAGIAATLAVHGTASTLEGKGSVVPSRRRAFSAAHPSELYRIALASALATARCGRGTTPRRTTSAGHARAAAPRSRQTAMRAHGSARGHVLAVRDDGVADAYCLSLRGIGCFALPGGVITSQSDGLGYYVVAEYPIVEHGMVTGSRH